MREDLCLSAKRQVVVEVEVVEQRGDVRAAHVHRLHAAISYFRTCTHPGAVFVPVSDAKAPWDFIVLRQRGPVPPATRALVEALSETVATLWKPAR